MKKSLPSGYAIKEIPTEEFIKLWQKPGKKIFNDKSLMYAITDIYSPRELKQLQKVREQFNKNSNAYRLNLGVFYKNKFVGWSWGFQETAAIFYMCNSAILPAHRRKGLYTALMREMLKRVEPMGFGKIYSRHMITNNDIIIAKMKQNFKITHFELSDAFGTMIHLTYFPNKIKNDILDFRSGHKRPTKKIKKIFKL